VHEKLIGSTEVEIVWRFFGRASTTYFKESQQGMSDGFFMHIHLTICMKRLALRSFLERHTIGAKTIMLTIFFSGERFLVLEALSKRKKFNQNDFL
jgi:hypothetical protein